MLNDYVPTNGTITLTAASASFTTNGAELQTRGFRGGDEVYVTGAGKWLIIASIDGENEGTLAYPCPADCAVEDGPLYVRRQADPSRTESTVRQFFDQIQQGLLLDFDKAGTLAARDQWDDQPAGFKFLRVDVLPFQSYIKKTDTSGDWSDGATYSGVKGDPGKPGSSDVVGTSTTSLAIGTGSKTFVIAETDRGWGIGARLRASSDANGANFMEGVVTAYSGTSLTLSVDLVGGSGTKADWTINLAGERGTPGLDGTGTGDVVGPSSSTDGHIMVADGTNGKKIKDSGKSPADFATAAQGALAASAVQPGDLGNAATRNVGTAAGTVAAGNDSRITGAMPKSGGTFTGAVSGQAPTADAHLATKKYVDDNGGGSGAPNAVIEDQKTSGTAGGTFTTGAWQTRDLNTEVRDPGDLISLSSNQFTPTVDGWVEWDAPAHNVGLHQTRLYNVTDDVVAGYGSNESAGGNFLETRSSGGCVVAAGKTYRIEHQSGTTTATTGFGRPTSFGGVEIYSRMRFWAL